MKATILMLIVFLLFSCDYQSPKVYETEQIEVHVYNELGDELNAKCNFITISKDWNNQYEGLSLTTPFNFNAELISKYYISIECLGYNTVNITYFSVNQRTFIMENL